MGMRLMSGCLKLVVVQITTGKNSTSFSWILKWVKFQCLSLLTRIASLRFGFEWFESFADRHGCKIIIMNQESLSPTEEVIQDLLAIIHCFSSRLYGLRKYKR